MGILGFLFGGSRGGGDGSSPEESIVVRSVGAEYTWVQRNCPGFRLGEQYVTEKDGKSYDVMTLQNDKGEDRTVYFDISSFYGR